MTLQEIEKINLELQEAKNDFDHNGSDSKEQEKIVEKVDDGELLVILKVLHVVISPKADE